MRENQKKNRLESELSRRSEQAENVIQEKDNEIEDLKEELSVLKKLHSTQLDENKKAEEEVNNVKSKLKDFEKTKMTLSNKVEALQKELNSTNEALKSQNSDPKIKELETMVKEFRQGKEEDERSIKELKELLDEAGQDYLAQDGQIKGLQSKLSNFKVKSPFITKECSPLQASKALHTGRRGTPKIRFCFPYLKVLKAKNL